MSEISDTHTPTRWSPESSQNNPKGADFEEIIQVLTERSGSLAMACATSPFSDRANLIHFITKHPLPETVLPLMPRFKAVEALPLCFGPVEGLHGKALFVAIKAERDGNGTLRPVYHEPIQRDDLMQVCTLSFDLACLQDEGAFNPQRVLYILCSASEFTSINEAALHKPAPRATVTIREKLEPPRLLMALVKEAENFGASDIHIEPFNEDFRIRFRVDGALRSCQLALTPKEATALISHIKTRASLRIDERRVEQAGVVALGGPDCSAEEKLLKGLTLRVSTLPTSGATDAIQLETCVIRIAKKTSSSQFRLENLGYSPEQLSILTRNLDAPDGLILLTGPTGSGKTTTLYTCLTHLNDENTKIITAEHPIEVIIPGIVQTPVDPAIGNNFTKLLTGFLRQDPDVIMVGEIRDRETAEASVSAVTTGHQVLSTMHVTTTSEVVTRLAELGVSPSQIIASLRLCIAQRLVRVFNPRLAGILEDYDAAAEINQLAGRQVLSSPLMLKRIPPDARHIDIPAMRGRTCVTEMWELGDSSKAAILSGTTNALQLQKIAMKEDGVEPLFIAGLRLAKAGRTSLDELRRTVLTGKDLREHADLVRGLAAQ